MRQQPEPQCANHVGPEDGWSVGNEYSTPSAPVDGSTTLATNQSWLQLQAVTLRLKLTLATMGGIALAVPGPVVMSIGPDPEVTAPGTHEAELKNAEARHEKRPWNDTCSPDGSVVGTA